MLTNLCVSTPDPLWGLISDFRADTRSEKIDLIVGVYRDASGLTPVMDAVRDAELRLAAAAASKSYRALSGNPSFNIGMANLLLGTASPVLQRQCTIQTVGGTGALRLLADFIARVSPTTTVWNTNPGYVNHRPIMNAAGLPVKTFSWVEDENGLDLATTLKELDAASAGDVVILHGCCHNPTGIDPSFDQWKMIADFCADKRLIPLVDMAYQGFGHGIEEDARALRYIAEHCDTVFVAASCSKNMGLYCERTGAAMVIAPNSSFLDNIRSTLENITRANYSMPPDHGAAIAAQLFEQPEPWLAELEVARQRVADIRRSLADALMQLGVPSRFQGLRRQKGMFSLLPLSEQQMGRLKDEFGIYGTAAGRINIAGLGPNQIDVLARAIKTVA